MKKYYINSRGLEYYKNVRKELTKFIFTFPFFIGLVSVLFIGGAKSKFHLYFAVFLLILMALFVIVMVSSMALRLNKTICEYSLDEDVVIFKSFKVLFLKGKESSVKKKLIKTNKEQIRINKKEILEGIRIRTDENNSLLLVYDFFSSELMDELNLG